MATPQDIIDKLEASLKVAHTFDAHLKKLINEVATYQPAVNAMKILLAKVGFDQEVQIEDNMKLLIDHHTALVAENTILRKTVEEREALMEQLREVVLESAD